MTDVNLSLLFSEEQVEEAAAEILKRTQEGVKKALEEAADSFYSSTQDYLNEHFHNAKEPIRNALIRDLAEGFSQKPEGGQYGPIRDRMWLEHRDEIEAALVSNRVKDLIWSCIHENVQRTAYSRREWLRVLVQVVAANWRELEGVCQDETARELLATRKELEELRESVRRWRRDEVEP